MYIEQGYKGLHERWRYVVGVILVFFGWQFFGAVPLMAAIFIKTDPMESLSADFMALSDTLGRNFFFFLVLLSFAVAMLSLWFTVKFVHKLPFKFLTTTRKKVDWKRVVYAFVLWGTISIGITFLDIFLEPDSYSFQFEPIPFLILLLLSIVFLPIQTSFEEFFTRGYLMQGIGIVSKNRWLPFLISSTLFGLLHIFNPEVEKLGYLILVYYVGTGFFLGILTLMDEGLELPLGFHAANNFFTAILVTADWAAFRTHALYEDISEPILGWDVLVPVLIVYPILLFIFSKKYGWTNWKDKLFGRVLTKEEFLALDNEDSSTVQA